MPTLYLLRHAKSDWSTAAGSDRERPLAPRGVGAAMAMRGHCEAAAVRPDVVYCSPAVRTRETLDLVIAALGGPRIDYDRGLYGGGADYVLDLLRTEAGDAGSAMVVGHNPTMSQLALWLAAPDPAGTRDRVEAKYPTGALATLEFTGPWDRLGPGDALLTAFVTPRDI